MLVYRWIFAFTGCGNEECRCRQKGLQHLTLIRSSANDSDIRLAILYRDKV